MNIKSIALSSVLLAMTSASVITTAQSRTAQSKLVLSSGGSCDLSLVDFFDFGGNSSGMIISGESNPFFLQYANAQYNPKEVGLDKGARIVSPATTSNSAQVYEIPVSESFSAILSPGAIGGITGGIVAGRNRSGGAGGLSPSGQKMIEDLAPFFASDAASMVRLPPAISVGPVDPIGHVLCVLKNRTKSNNTNERKGVTVSGVADPTLVDEVFARTIAITLEGADGKVSKVITPISMGAMKLTRADAGRGLDAVSKEKKIKSWVKDCYDRRIAPFDPSLTNTLQFDIPTAEADQLATQFQAGQRPRVKVKFPWLCDVYCAMTEPISQTWTEKISSTTSRVSITLMPEACRLLPTVNK